MKRYCLLLFFSFLALTGISQIKEIDSLKQALTLARHDTAKVMILSELSNSYLGSNSDSSLLLAQQSLDLARKINFRKGEARALFHLGQFYRLLSDIPNSMRTTLRGLQLAEENGFRQEAILCNYNLAQLHINFLDNYPMALAHIKKAKQLNATEHNDFGKYWGVVLDFAEGNFHLKYRYLDSAAVNYDRVWANIQNQPNILTPFLIFMGEFKCRKGNYKEAQNYFNQSAANSPNLRDATLLFFLQASCYQEMGKIDSCIFYARKSLTAAEKIGFQRDIMNSANLLAGIYEVQNQSEALRYYKIAKLANEKVFGQQKVQELQRIITEEIQRQQEAEKQKIAYENRIRLYALLSGLAIVLLGAFFLYRNNRQKLKANAVLEKAYSELEATHKNLKSTQAQLIQSEKMASLGELTAGIAHEIQNPLNFVNNYSEVNVELIEEIKEEIENGNLPEIKAIVADLEENEAKIHHHGQRADSIVRSMMQHSRTNSGTKEPTNLNALADEYLRLAYHGLRAKDSSFQADFSTDFDETLPMVEVVQQDIGRVLLNIINNAFQACAERSRSTVNEKQQKGVEGYQPSVKVTTKRLSFLTGEGGGGRRYGEVKSGEVEITISDNGPGIPDPIKDKIFQPFFTTKPTGQGTGLGLSLAYDIVKAHGGELRVESNEGEGTTFFLILPL